MDLRGWDERYRLQQHPEDLEAAPARLVIDAAKLLPPGKALDLACGTGRNALWLAGHGWNVTAADGAPAAIDILQHRAADAGVMLDARVANLEKGEYIIERAAWDLIVMSYYLQRDLFEPAKHGVVPGGILLAIVHITESGEEPTYKRLRPGELLAYFDGWEILHSYEGKPADPAHQRAVAEIVARRPTREAL
jgi:tellurite methyltransferase